MKGMRGRQHFTSYVPDAWCVRVLSDSTSYNFVKPTDKHLVPKISLSEYTLPITIPEQGALFCKLHCPITISKGSAIQVSFPLDSFLIISS